MSSSADDDSVPTPLPNGSSQLHPDGRPVTATEWRMNQQNGGSRRRHRRSRRAAVGGRRRCSRRSRRAAVGGRRRRSRRAAVGGFRL